MTEAEIVKSLNALEDFLKDRKDFAHGEAEHVTASRGLVALSDLRKHIKALPTRHETE